MNKYVAIPTTIKGLFTLLIVSSGLFSCQKQSEATFLVNDQKRTVIDHVLDLEGMYMIKYQFQYNEHYQVSKIFRGERFSQKHQMQLIALAHYDEKNKSQLPDSISTYNTRGFKTGVIHSKSYNKIAKLSSQAELHWPERTNRLLLVPGGQLALAIASKKIDWSGAGHLGSGSTIQIMDHLKHLNRPTLKDSIRIYVEYKTDGSKGNFDDFQILFDASGNPIDMGFYDLINANFEQVKVNYRQE